MKYNNETLNRIYDKTDGYCHLCNKKLSFKNYGTHNSRGSWHIDHSLPKARGGTNHINNLMPACIPCNLLKGTSSSRYTKNILAQKQVVYKSKSDKVPYTLLGAGIGIFFGPVGFLVGTAVGGYLQEKQ